MNLTETKDQAKLKGRVVERMLRWHSQMHEFLSQMTEVSLQQKQKEKPN
jgi:hypothetical protein